MRVFVTVAFYAGLGWLMTQTVAGRWLIAITLLAFLFGVAESR